MTKKDYPYIWAWGRLLQSFDYYMEREEQRAKEDDAPHNAIFKRQDGTWATFAEIADSHVKEAVEALAKQFM